MQTKFGGMMQAQSSTFEGMMSNLQDWVGQAMRVMGGPIFDALKGQLSSLCRCLARPSSRMPWSGIGQALGNMATSGISALQNLASSVTPVRLQPFRACSMFVQESRRVHGQHGRLGERS